MTTYEQRLAISKVYSSSSWKKKVENMSDSQVIAVYLRFEKEGKFKQAPIQSKKWKLKKEKKYGFWG